MLVVTPLLTIMTRDSLSWLQPGVRRGEEGRGGERCALADSQTRTGRDIVRTEEAADQTEEAIIYILRGARYQTLDIS